MSARVTEVSTIGVAIAIPEPWASQLREHRLAFGDPRAHAVPAHVTLMPPTPITEVVAPIEDHLAEVAERHAAFPLRLRGTATFRPVSPVVFLTLAEGISRCEQLAADVVCGPLAQKREFPYHPHVTVAHHLDEEALDRAFEELANFDCAFDVETFQLFVHGDDGVWRPLQDYKLGGS
jgi:2'-5' RNA ligase